MSTAIISYSVASAVIERLGLEYTWEQEMEADQSAVELLKFIDISPSALSSALSKIKEYCILTGNYYALSGKGSHPAIDDRIEAIGEPTEFFSEEYDKHISLVNSFNAILEINKQHFLACKSLTNRNLSSGIATEDDYVLKSRVLLYMYNTPESNAQALQLINEAKSLDVYPTINLYKQEGLVLTRLGRHQEAESSFAKYLDQLEENYAELERIKNDNLWMAYKNLLDNEVEWSKKMIHKLRWM